MTARSVTATFAIAVSIAVLLVVFQRGFTSAATQRDALTLGPNRLSAARLDLDLSGATQPLTVTELVPGDRVVRSISLRNAGTLPMLVSVRATGDGSALGAALDLRAWTSTSCERPTTTPVSPSARAIGTTPVPLLGDVATGRQDGDIALRPGEDVVVCLEAAFDIDAGNELQRTSTSPTLLFDAEHDLRAMDRAR